MRPIRNIVKIPKNINLHQDQNDCRTITLNTAVHKVFYAISLRVFEEEI